MKKKFITLALALLAFFALSLPAGADTGYTGPINPETGEPYGEGGSAQTGGDRAALSDTMYYDYSEHDYVYPIADALGEVHVSAADGMYLTSSVYVRTRNDTAVTVYLNGSAYTGSLENCTTAGDYVVSALVNGQTRRLMGFTLVGRSTNALHTFVAPDGFYVTSALRGGENIYLDRYSVDMEEEGEYAIVYTCSATGMEYKLNLTVDRTPPALLFSGKLDRQGRVRSKLDFQGLQNGDRIYLTRSGNVVEPELNGDGTGTVYDPGNYVMIVTDSAGNSVEYDFIILQYFNLQSWVFFILVVAVIAGVVGYVLVQRKRLKIG